MRKSDGLERGEGGEGGREASSLSNRRRIYAVTPEESQKGVRGRGEGEERKVSWQTITRRRCKRTPPTFHPTYVRTHSDVAF